MFKAPLPTYSQPMTSVDVSRGKTYCAMIYFVNFVRSSGEYKHGHSAEMPASVILSSAVVFNTLTQSSVFADLGLAVIMLSPIGALSLISLISALISLVRA